MKLKRVKKAQKMNENIPKLKRVEKVQIMHDNISKLELVEKFGSCKNIFWISSKYNKLRLWIKILRLKSLEVHMNENILKRKCSKHIFFETQTCRKSTDSEWKYFEAHMSWKSSDLSSWMKSFQSLNVSKKLRSWMKIFWKLNVSKKLRS